jgi:hypothetical protein
VERQKWEQRNYFLQLGPHLLKFLELPKTAPPIGDQLFYMSLWWWGEAHIISRL